MMIIKNFYQKPLTGIMFTALALCACGGNTELDNDPVMVKAQQCIDSCNQVLPKLNALAGDTTRALEFEALKAKNNYAITQENLEKLAMLRDSLRNHADQIKNTKQFKTEIQSQTQYMYALLTSASAILNRNSLSIGNWQHKAPEQKSSAIVGGTAKPE